MMLRSHFWNRCCYFCNQISSIFNDWAAGHHQAICRTSVLTLMSYFYLKKVLVSHDMELVVVTNSFPFLSTFLFVFTKTLFSKLCIIASPGLQLPLSLITGSLLISLYGLIALKPLFHCWLHYYTPVIVLPTLCELISSHSIYFKSHCSSVILPVRLSFV